MRTESQLRRAASRLGLRLEKSRREADLLSPFRLIDQHTNGLASPDGLDLEAVEAHLHILGAWDK